MEQGFLNRSNKASLKNDGNMGSLLSELAKKVKNIDGKILGRDGKPMIPYRCVKDKVTFSDDVAVVMDNKNDDGEVGSFKSTSINTENNHGAAGVIGEDCTLADVIIPQEEVDTLSARFENSLYGYFVGRRLAFPVVLNYARNAWGKYGFKNVMVHQGFFMFQFSTKEGMENVLDQGPWRIRSVPLILNVWNPISELKREDIKKVPVWVKLFNVPVVAYSKVGLNLITAKLGRLIKFDAHTSNMCLNSWGMNSYARVLVEISAEKELVSSIVVAVFLIDIRIRGIRLCHKKEKGEIQNTNKEDGLGYDKRKSKGINQASKANNTSRFRFSKRKPKLIYRPVVKPTNTMLSSSKPKDSSSHYSKEDVNVACDKPTKPSNVTTDDSSRPTNENAKSKFIQDDIDLGQLRSYIDTRMEEDKVINLNTDVVVSTNNSYAPEKDNGSKKVSFLEKFLKTREASKNKHHSLSDSEESEVEEVCMPDHISGGGSLDRLEDDLDGYDGYEAQFCDLNDYAIESAIRILNIVPTKKVDKTPYELWYGKVPNLSYLKVWGCEALVKRDTPNKLQQRYVNSWRKNLISQEVSGRAVELEEIQDEDISPSENTSEILMEVEGFEPPQEEVVPVRRSARTHRAPERLCLNVELDAMNVEMQSMKDNQVWCLVDLPPNGKTVGDIVMSDSKDSTVTYTEVVLQTPPSPDYVPGLEEPKQAPPLPDFVLEPVYPEFMPPEDEVLPAEEQPLPAAASPTADSPGYVPDPKKDPEEDDDEDPEEDLADYHADRGDNGDDEDELSDNDEDDDVDIEGDEKEEEHPASADSTTVALPVVDHAPSAEETEPFETDESEATPPPHPAYRVTARISIQDEPPTPFWSDIKVARLLAIPTPPPSPLSLWSSSLPQIPSPPLPLILSPLPVSSPPPTSPTYLLVYKAAMIRQRAEAPSTSHSPPPHIILSHTRADTPPSGTPSLLPIRLPTSSPPSLCTRSERARLLLPLDRLEDEMLVDMPGASATNDTELGRRMTEFATGVRQDTYEIYVRLDDEQTERQLMADRLNMLYRDRGYVTAYYCIGSAGSDYRVAGSGPQETGGDYRVAGSRPQEIDTVH
ncbi:putative reverse transcriptase domain-containing protein [Tanacetum coccineum]